MIPFDEGITNDGDHLKVTHPPTCTRTIDAARLSLPYFRFLITGCSTGDKQNERRKTTQTHTKIDHTCKKNILFLNFTAEIRLLTINQ